MPKNAISIMKKISVLLLTIGIGYAIAGWDGKTRTKPDTTVIDKKTFYLIETEANLAWFADTVNRTSGKSTLNAKLTAPMNMRHKLFVPIAAGKGDTQFGGIFDGNGFSISNLYIDAAKIGEIENPHCEKDKATCNAQNVAFIAVLAGGTVKNLILENVDITASTNVGDILDKDRLITVGSVVAWQTSGTIEGCFTTGTIQTSGTGNVVGGIVGNMKGGTVKNNLSTISIRVSGNDSYVGGTVGVIRGSTTLEANAYDGNSLVNNGNGSIGGIIGLLENGTATVSQVYFDSDIAEDGIGKAVKDSGKAELNGSTTGKADINTAEVSCGLNKGEWKDGSCSASGIWSKGSSHITLNGVSLDGNGNIVYTVKFDANKGTFAENAKTAKLLGAGEKISASEITEPVRGDTVFAGWALAADATAPAQDLGTVTKATTVYAVWKKMFTVTFIANEDTTKKSVAEGTAIDMEGVSITTSFEKDETKYYFAGWATEENAEEALGTLGTADKDITLYALWREEVTYTVIFDAGIGGYNVAFVKEGGKAEKPEDPKATGFSFDGWTDGENEYDFDAVVTGDLTLSGHWKPVEYKITYEMDGGKNSSDNPATYTIESGTITLASPTKDGYIFSGWFYDKKFTDRASQISKGSSGDLTLYAKWEIVTYEIVYMAGRYGSGIVAADIKSHGIEIELSQKTYSRSGYKQVGWATSEDGKQAYKLGETYTKNEKLSLFPVWEEVPESIERSIASNIQLGVSAHGRSLEIYGIAPGTSLSVFDMNGRIVHKSTASATSKQVNLAKAGIYLVKAGNKTARVAIK